MNRSTKSSSVSLKLSDAIDGFLVFKTAEGLSPATISSYSYTLTRWMSHIGEMKIEDITTSKINEYLSWLRTAYKPVRFSGSEQPLSPKSIRNVYIVLRSFFHWIDQEFQTGNPSASVPSPKFPKTHVNPFTREEVEKIIGACMHSRVANTSFRKKFVMRRPSATRDVAIVMILFDTGIRASEFCHLQIGDVDLASGKVEIKKGAGGGAKGGKGRIVYLGKRSRKAIWKYLTEREDRNDRAAPLFTSHLDRPFNIGSLRILVRRLGIRAGVTKCHPHRFRHTFAITYLRSQGDIFTLQMLLGHGTLDMVRHYAQIAQTDVEDAHRRASPADNWRL